MIFACLKMIDYNILQWFWSLIRLSEHSFVFLIHFRAASKIILYYFDRMRFCRMFSLLLQLVGQSIVDEVSSAPGEDVYSSIMRSNGADGPRFVKPQRGHEDGCVEGVCAESHAGQFSLQKWFFESIHPSLWPSCWWINITEDNSAALFTANKLIGDEFLTFYESKKK